MAAFFATLAPLYKTLDLLLLYFLIGYMALLRFTDAPGWPCGFNSAGKLIRRPLSSAAAGVDAASSTDDVRTSSNN